MQRASLFPRVRAATQRHLNGYIQLPQIVTDAGIEKFIGPSVWGNQAVRICLSGSLFEAAFRVCLRQPFHSPAPPVLSRRWSGATGLLKPE
eukprot:scaffold29805_cov45-Isochrysis_galbana.AAC.1